jgi:outer membrane protein
LGQSELPALSKENYIGVEIQIPIFDGLSRRSEIHQAQAQAEMKRQEMREAEQQVTIDIWSSVQTLQTDTENLRNTNMVMQSARDAYEASEERYRSGVGNIIEALSAQRALSTSEEQSIQARLDWRNARLQKGVYRSARISLGKEEVRCNGRKLFDGVQWVRLPPGKG